MIKENNTKKDKKSEDPFGSFWGQIDKASVKKFKHDFEEKKTGRKFGYFMTAVVNLALLWVFRELPSWTNVLNNQYTQNVLWVFNILFIATAIVNLLYLFLDKPWFRAPMQLIIAIITFFAWFNLYEIWPFDFASVDMKDINNIMRGVTIFILVVIAFSAITEFFSILFGFRKKNK